MSPAYTTDIAPFPVQAEPPIFSDYRPSTTVSTVVALGVQLSHMQGAVGILDMIRKHDPKLITANLKQVEDLMRLLIDREEGKAPVWEGIRVIRERRL